MKIQSVNSYTPLITHNRPAQNKQHINFGFGEDYGDDSFLQDSDHREGNLIEYIGAIIAFPVVCIQEMISDRISERRAARNNEQIDRQDLDDEE